MSDAAEVVEELGRRFRAGDRDGAWDLLDPDLRIQQPASLPHGGWHDGPGGMDAMGATFAEHWERTIGPAEVRACGDTAVQVTTQTWTSQGLIDQVGEDNVLFETDFPHPTCLYPDPLGAVEDKIGALRPETRRKVLSENAAALYRI